MITKLSEKVQERKRFTKKLQKVVAEIANRIVSIYNEEAAVVVDGRTVKVRRKSSNVGSYLHLAVEEWDGRFGVIDDSREPGSWFYLHNDFNVTIRIAEKETYVWFANHVKEIVEAFIKLEDKRISELKTALENAKLQIDDILNDQNTQKNELPKH